MQAGVRTSKMTLSLISWNSALATTSLGSPPCKSAMTRMPSSSRSTSINQLSALTSGPIIRLSESISPRTFGHHERACRKDSANDTLDKQGDSPREVGFQEGAEVVDPL